MPKLLIIKCNKTKKDGITNVIINFMSGLADSDFEVDYVSPGFSDDGQTYSLVANFAKHIYVISRDIKHPIRYIRRLKSHIELNNYDIVHIHGSSATMGLETLAAKLARCKVRIAHSHSSSCQHKFLHYLCLPLIWLTHTHGFACSKSAGEWVFRNGRFSIIHNAIDTSKFAFSQADRFNIRNQYKIDNQTILLGHVGLLDDNKNQVFLLKILKSLITEGINVKLMLIGDGPKRAYLNNVANTCDVNDHVIFLGSRHDVYQYYSAFDIFVFPSHYEGLPLTLLESQSNGLKCIVSSNVSDEVNISGRIEFLPISDDCVSKWSRIIRNYSYSEDLRKTNSESNIRIICDNGYDVERNSNLIKCKYLTYINTLQ